MFNKKIKIIKYFNSSKFGTVLKCVKIDIRVKVGETSGKV